MKKYLILFIFFLLTGCTKNESYINTIVIEENDLLVNINYPITNTNLDFNIRNDLKEIYAKYKDKKVELNVDYTYYKINNMISVVLFIYVNGFNKENYVKSYFYKDKITTIEDFCSKELLNKILIEEIKNTNLSINIINSKYEFGFDNNNLYLYFNNLNNYDTIKIPLSKLNIEFEQNTKVIKELVIPNYESTNKKKIALTFDDGPSKYTDKIIEYLHENNCKATFFVLGNKVTNYSKTINKSISYGNEIGNHSYNHKLLTKLNKEEMKNQIEKTQELIYQNTGYIPKILRPTYGSVNSILRNITDLNIVLWNVDTLDWKYKSSNTISNRAIRNLKDGNIILMHDIYNRTYEALKKIVPIIKQKGYECVTISELKNE